MEEDGRLPSAEQRDGSRIHDPEQLLRSLSIHPPRRSLEKGKKCVGGQTAVLFNRLPRTVIERILYFVDANTFASLTLLNRKWRRISDSSLLYAHHLSQCPSFSLTQKAISGSPHSAHLASLKHSFAIETRRNAFDVFLRPRKTLIKLISTSLSASTPFPQGEAFRFSFSPNARLVLCISSSRIVVLDVTSEAVTVRHELKTWRRPLNATILDDGSLLAVVSSAHRVNIYRLENSEASLIQNLELNDVPRALSLSPTGGVLAIAYDDRIEVHAIGEATIATERRAVRCAGVDSIAFSSDGGLLLGSSIGPDQTGGLVTVTVPFYTEADAEDSPREAQIRTWTSQILFPDINQGFSHASLLPSHTEGEGSWLLGFDKEVGAFRAIGVSDVNSGTAYFSSPMSSNGSQESQPAILPTVDPEGELAALGFQDSGLWVYGVPARLDIAPVVAPAEQTHSSQSNGQSSPAEEPAVGVQDNLRRLQQSVTKPKMLIGGHQMSDMSGITAARWVRYPSDTYDYRRLVAVAPGGISLPTIGEEDVPVDGGRLLLLDFERSPKDGHTAEVNIEIGEAEPMMLNEPNANLDIEVELERRRTRLRRGGPTPRTRVSARESYPAASSMNHASTRIRRNSSFFSNSSNEVGDGDFQNFPDSPYDNTQPRSRDTLRRAATAAASSRGRYNPAYRQETSHRVYDNSRVHPVFQTPHESDADNWVPPPPPYSTEPEQPLPEYLRRSLLPSRTEPARVLNEAPAQVRRSQTTRLENMSEEASSSRTSLSRLNTISGSRLASRMRRSTRDSEVDGLGRRNSWFRRSSLSRQSTPRPHNNPSPVPLSPILQEPSATPQVRPQTSIGSPEPTMARPYSPTAPTWLAAAQRTSNRVNPSAGVTTRNEPEETQDVVPVLPNMASDVNSYQYFHSSPNLHVTDPQYSALGPRDSQYRSGYLRSSDRRSQSQDIRQSMATIPRLTQRASTDPALSSSSQASNDLWRRRIEEWNERTIHESRKRKTKCVVM